MIVRVSYVILVFRRYPRRQDKDIQKNRIADLVECPSTLELGYTRNGLLHTFVFNGSCSCFLFLLKQWIKVSEKYIEHMGSSMQNMIDYVTLYSIEFIYVWGCRCID